MYICFYRALVFSFELGQSCFMRSTMRLSRKGASQRLQRQVCETSEPNRIAWSSPLSTERVLQRKLWDAPGVWWGGGGC